MQRSSDWIIGSTLYFFKLFNASKNTARQCTYVMGIKDNLTLTLKYLINRTEPMAA